LRFASALTPEIHGAGCEILRVIPRETHRTTNTSGLSIEA
jgi:hypothetical protein